MVIVVGSSMPWWFSTVEPIKGVLCGVCEESGHGVVWSESVLDE